MVSEKQVASTMITEAGRLLAAKDFRHALLLYETILKQSPQLAEAWLGAAQAAMELGFGERALDLLKEQKLFYDEAQVERWVNLRSETFRRLGMYEDGIAFVDEWLDKAGPETRTKLLLRKAAFHLLRKEAPKAQAATRQAWESPFSRSPSLLHFAANMAFMSGLTGIAAQAGREMMRSGSRVAGLCVFLSSKFYGSRGPVLRVGLLLFTAGMVFVPIAQPFVLALSALLALAALVTWRRLRPFAMSFAMPLLVVLIAVGMLVATKLERLGNAIAIAILALVVCGALVALWRGKRGSRKRAA
jgi:tetratricopeptide (TPR) repeat protein